MPHYDLGYIKRLARDNGIHIVSRAYRFILNRYDGEDPIQVARTVVASIEINDFYKTDELSKKPGYYADVYRNVHCEDYPEEVWYVKLLVVDEKATLDIWSMNWEGYLH